MLIIIMDTREESDKDFKETTSPARLRALQASCNKGVKFIFIKS